MNYNVDITAEMKELHKAYTDGLEHLEVRQRGALSNLVDCMKTFLSLYEEREQFAGKLNRLNTKMSYMAEETEEDDE